LDVSSGTAEFCLKEKFSIFFCLLAHLPMALIGAKLMPHNSVISTIDTMTLIVL